MEIYYIIIAIAGLMAIKRTATAGGFRMLGTVGAIVGWSWATVVYSAVLCGIAYGVMYIL